MSKEGQERKEKNYKFRMFFQCRRDIRKDLEKKIEAWPTQIPFGELGFNPTNASINYKSLKKINKIANSGTVEIS